MEPSLYIVILNWNRPDDTLTCLNAVCRSSYPNFSTVVVDNGSTDDSVSRIREAFPQIPILQNDSNLGYTGGNNIGIRYAMMHNAKYIVLLNNDVFVEPDTFKYLITAAETDPAIGAVGCKVRIFEDPDRLWAAGECFPRGEPYPFDDGRFDIPKEINYAVGCCILLRKSTLETVGLLDQAYFAIYEEVDWCYRARKAGYQILYAPDAVVQHKISVSFTSNWSSAYHYLFARNRLRFYEQCGILPKNWRRIRGVFFVWRDETWFVLRHGKSKLKRVYGVTRGVLDYLYGSFGHHPIDV
jgi:GT2 family glycosyltransferase